MTSCDYKCEYKLRRRSDDLNQRPEYWTRSWGYRSPAEVFITDHRACRDHHSFCCRCHQHFHLVVCLHENHRSDHHFGDHTVDHHKNHDDEQNTSNDHHHGDHYNVTMMLKVGGMQGLTTSLHLDVCHCDPHGHHHHHQHGP